MTETQERAPQSAAEQHRERQSAATIEQRCVDHSMIESECVYCAYPALSIESDTERSERASSRLASAMRASLRRAIAASDRVRGYHLIDRETLAAITATATAIAREYQIDSGALADHTIDSIALWLSRQKIERVEALRSDRRYARALASSIATHKAQRSGSGRGSMPRLSLDQHAPECETGECVAWCGSAMLSQLLDASRVRSKRASVSTLSPAQFAALTETERAERIQKIERSAHTRRGFGTRGVSAPERDSLAGTLDYERQKRSPEYARWLDVFGDTAPDVGTAHPLSVRAPGVPDRDSASLRRASLLETARALSLDTRLISAALSCVYRIERKNRSVYAIDIERAAALASDDRHSRSIRRSLRAQLEQISSTERESIDTDSMRSTHRLALTVREQIARAPVSKREQRAIDFPIAMFERSGSHSISADSAPVSDRLSHYLSAEHRSYTLDDRGESIESEYPQSECALCQRVQRETQQSATASTLWTERQRLSESDAREQRESAMLRRAIAAERAERQRIALIEHRATNARLAESAREQRQQRESIERH